MFLIQFLQIFFGIVLSTDGIKLGKRKKIQMHGIFNFELPTIFYSKFGIYANDFMKNISNHVIINKIEYDTNCISGSNDFISDPKNWKLGNITEMETDPIWIKRKYADKYPQLLLRATAWMAKYKKIK